MVSSLGGGFGFRCVVDPGLAGGSGSGLGVTLVVVLVVNDGCSGLGLGGLRGHDCKSGFDFGCRS